MFSISRHASRSLAVGLLLFVVGCSSEISERTLVGTWEASGSGVGTAFKIKSQNPDAKSSDIVAASKALAATSLELKRDGTYTLGYGINKFDGSWSFDSEDKIAELDITTVNDKPADVKNLLTATFLCVMDPADGTMKLYPIDRKGYDEAKTKRDKGVEALSVKLRKV